METNSNDVNQSQLNANPASNHRVTEPATQSSSHDQHQQHQHQHHELNELDLDVQQHVNEEVEAENYETVYVIEVSSIPLVK